MRLEAVLYGLRRVATDSSISQAYTTGGGFADYCIAPAEKTVKLPEGTSTRDAAVVLLQGLTALTFVKEAHEVKPGQFILIHAAAGGLGLLLVQLCVQPSQTRCFEVLLMGSRPSALPTFSPVARSSRAFPHNPAASTSARPSSARPRRKRRPTLPRRPAPTTSSCTAKDATSSARFTRLPVVYVRFAYDPLEH